MALVLYNTLARAKQPFEPLDPANVRLYVCGPTVYDYAHIGNARPVVVFDVLYRLLRRAYGPEHVTYVRNITDVDDKIIAAAEASGEAIDEITRRTTRAFHQDMAALGTLPPEREPRATEHIPEMIALIERLLERGHAYQGDGHVLFNVPSAPDYGRLSGRDRKEQIAGARVEVAPYKKDPADCVLWKPSAGDLPGWPSPWGRGRPGWHLECSAMSEAHLGVPFDIHGGGLDLVFPHHENEIAQSTCAAGGAEFVRYWMHNGYLTVEGEKMAKSVGNVLRVRDIVKQVPGEVARLNLLMTHYRRPLDWTSIGLEDAKRKLDHLYKALWRAKDSGIHLQQGSRAPDGVSEALEDDLNTSLAIAELHDTAHSLHRASDTDNRAEQLRLSGELSAGGALLGVLGQDPEAWFKQTTRLVRAGDVADLVVEELASVSLDEIHDLIKERAAARSEKDYKTADQIRQKLESSGIVLEDRPDGTTDWRRTG